MCKTEKVKLEIKQTWSSLTYWAFIRQNSIEVNGITGCLAKRQPEWVRKIMYRVLLLHTWKNRQSGISSSGRRKVAQLSVYFLPCRFNAHFARSRQDTPIHYSSKIRQGEDKVCSRGNTIKVLSLTLTLFTNRVLKHPYYTKTILKLISKCCVCLFARLHGGD